MLLKLVQTLENLVVSAVSIYRQRANACGGSFRILSYSLVLWLIRAQGFSGRPSALDNET